MGFDSPHEPKPVACPNCSYLIDFSVKPVIKSEHQAFDLVEDSGKDGVKNQMDTKINVMDHLIDSLLRQRATISRHRNQYTPMGRLPVEILSEIFRCAFHGSGQDNIADPLPTAIPLLLGKICSEWRNIAWGLSELWCTFHCLVSQKKLLVQDALLKEWIGRSGMRLLSIRISLENEVLWTSDAPTCILDTLIPYCQRWQSLNLTLPQSWYDILKGVKGKLDNLASLTVRPPGHHFVLESLNFFSNSPLLRSLTSSHYYLNDLDYPWTQLTEASFGTASTDEAIEIVLRCPNLVKCQFDNLSDGEGTFPLQHLIHKNIQRLTVTMNTYTSLSPFLDLLTLPNLGFLGLILPGIHLDPLPIIQNLIERSKCPLKTIQITGVHIESEEIIDFLAHNEGVVDINNKPSSQIQGPTIA